MDEKVVLQTNLPYLSDAIPRLVNAGKLLGNGPIVPIGSLVRLTVGRYRLLTNDSSLHERRPHTAEFLDTDLTRLSESLPDVLKYRLQNTLDHFARAARLIDADLEMASFRAICGQEEAATTLMAAIRSPVLGGFQVQFIPAPAQGAVLACVIAVGSTLSPFLKEFQIIFDQRRKRMPLNPHTQVRFGHARAIAGMADMGA